MSCARGFTLVEMLVVISIIIVLMALLLPAIGKVYKSAQRTAIANDLQAIATALEAYKKDFNDYPRVQYAPGMTTTDPQRPNPMTGAQVLCWALIGPAGKTDLTNPPATSRLMQDGADGPGFATRRLPGTDNTLNTADDVIQGKVTPSYLASGPFDYGDPVPRVATDPPPYKAPGEVLRYASAARPNVKVPPTGTLSAPYVDSKIVRQGTVSSSESARYDADDNLFWFTDDPMVAANDPGNPTGSPAGNAGQAAKALKRIRAMLGDIKNASDDASNAPYGTPDGVIQASETAVDVPFILWATGPDERFGPIGSEDVGNGFLAGPALTADDMRYVRECDDVTNFPR
jgi:prepilin-type N-terminal cleavage/methylation domain-containing protein